MKQILQYLGNGETILAEVPCPKRSGGSLLCETKTTLVSLGTEKMLIDFGKGSLLAKARAQPDKVKQVLQKIKTDGLKTTIDTVKAKLDSPIQLGYCNVGTVLESDPQSKFQKGDRVVNNGPHAEFVNVAENLAAKIPDNVTDEAAAFTVVGAIGLQGVRLLNPTLGEKIVVSGLGLIGLLTVQILKANGCQVLGIDFDPKKLELARQFGAETVDLGQGQDPVRIAEHWTNGVGVDGIVITASTKSDQLIHQAASMCRKRARIILVGVIGLNLQRADFYEKELSFQVSCSYGPGRYEDSYERKGMDYPIGFVRWTEQRNFEAILELLADGKIDVSPLITHRFNFDDALTGYQAVDEPGAMGILLNYGTDNGQPCQIEDANANEPTAYNTSDQEISNFSNARIAFVGAGGFTTRMLLPLLPKQNVTLDTIVSSTGVSAAHAAKKFGFASAESDSSLVWNNRDINTVFITTPHNSHAKLVCDALAAGKHVFVEKPLALTHDELNQVVEKIENAPKQLLMIGFNRRFSPHTQKIKKWLAGTPGPKAIVITMNAGAIPANHWTQNLEVGGGRINGEACHLIDLARYLADAPILSTSVNTMVSGDGSLGDCVAINLSFEDGSIATIHYLANGSKDFPKERFEVFAGGKVAVCDNFRSSRLVGSKEKFKTRGQDKGHAAELKAFVDAIHNGTTPPIPVSELIEVTRSTLDAASAVHQAVNKSR
ncbi:bi-domain-containing oxidoreductase [Mariniblastus sp.]|nr:bi-domain-containing oxidoreductase [Mariniblastus sp.]